MSEERNDNAAILEASYLLRRASEEIRRLEIRVMEEKLNAYERVFRMHEQRDSVAMSSYRFTDELEKAGKFLEFKYSGQAAEGKS